MIRTVLPLAAILVTASQPFAQHRARYAAPEERPLQLFFGEGSGNLPGFGYAVGNAGDVNNDGTGDLVVGAPYEGPQRLGQLHVYSGTTGARLLGPLSHPEGEYVGFSVAGIGDVNGDGYDDVATGDPQFGGVASGREGQVFVFSGFDGAVLFHVSGDGNSDEFGWSVAAAGDVDQDGVPDWAAGAVNDHDFSTGPSYVRIFSGADASEIRTYTLAGSGNRLGQSLVNAGDVNGDTVPDLLIGASGAGFVQMRSGADGSILWNKSAGTSSGLGWDVDVAGDVDGDGQLDVVVGVPWLGSARVFRASDGMFVTGIVGPAGDFFGGAVAGLGDVNGDGFGDLAIGAKWSDSPRNSFPGTTWIYSGQDESILLTVHGTRSGDRGGFALTALSDLDGDGVAELAIGAPQDTNSGPGYTRVYSGRRR